MVHVVTLLTLSSIIATMFLNSLALSSLDLCYCLQTGNIIVCSGIQINQIHGTQTEYKHIIETRPAPSNSPSVLWPHDTISVSFPSSWLARYLVHSPAATAFPRDNTIQFYKSQIIPPLRQSPHARTHTHLPTVYLHMDFTVIVASTISSRSSK